MNDLEQLLEQLAERGTPRGADDVFDAAHRDAGRLHDRVRRHRGLVVVAVLALAGLATAAAVVALRDDGAERLATTPGPTVTDPYARGPGASAPVPSGALSDPVVTCVVERNGERTTGSIDPTVVPSSATVEVDASHRLVVSVVTGGPLDVTAPTVGYEQRSLRVDVYAPEGPGSLGRNESLPDGVVFRAETAVDLRRAILLAGGGGGVQFSCNDARSRLLAASEALQKDLVTQPLALGANSVRTPKGWVRTTNVPGGSSVFTTFTDPANGLNRYEVVVGGSLGSWYEADGVPGAITPLVPADAKASLVQFGPHAWRYERPAVDPTRITVGAWIAVPDPGSNKPNWYIAGEVTVPADQRMLADAVLTALMGNYDRSAPTVSAPSIATPAMEFPASLAPCDGANLEYHGNGLYLMRFFNPGETCGLAGVPQLRGLDESGTWRPLRVVPLLMAPTNGPTWTGAFSQDLVAVVSLRGPGDGCTPTTQTRYSALELTMRQGTVIIVDIAFDDAGCGFAVTPFSADSQDR